MPLFLLAGMLGVFNIAAKARDGVVNDNNKPDTRSANLSPTKPDRLIGNLLAA